MNMTRRGWMQIVAGGTVAGVVSRKAVTADTVMRPPHENATGDYDQLGPCLHVRAEDIAHLSFTREAIEDTMAGNTYRTWRSGRLWFDLEIKGPLAKHSLFGRVVVDTRLLVDNPKAVPFMGSIHGIVWMLQDGRVRLTGEVLMSGWDNARV